MSASSINVEPATPLVLTRDEHVLLGELVEIMGLVESMLIRSAERVDRGMAHKVRQTTGGGQATPWAMAVTGRVSDPEIAALIPGAMQEIIDVADERNAFVHALFEGDYVAGYVEPGYQTTSATRSKTGARRTTADIQSVRNRAANLSRLLDRIVRAVA